MDGRSYPDVKRKMLYTVKVCAGQNNGIRIDGYDRVDFQQHMGLRFIVRVPRGTARVHGLNTTIIR